MESITAHKVAHKVAVIATEDTDKQLMIQLLQKAGYNAGFFDNSDSLASIQTEYSAMIVCHRRGTTVPPLLGLPSFASGQRVVVFSDCKAEHTVVNALEQGAHHFFDLAESPTVLQARLEAALRQHSLQAKRILDVAPFKFNLERRSVYKDGKLINLSPKEYEFAYYLFANRHRVVINSELMTSVWSLPSSMDARRIDTAACRVRKKMQLAEASSGWCLRRIRRVGYELLWRGEIEQVETEEQGGSNEHGVTRLEDARTRPQAVASQSASNQSASNQSKMQTNPEFAKGQEREIA